MSGKKPPFPTKLCIKNRQAHFAYTFLDRCTAGLMLQGTEIKSIRMGKASLQEAYCYFKEGSLWIKGMHIGAYLYGNLYNHEEKRDRQLLLQKKELQQLSKNQAKGLAIIPVELFINQRGFAKLVIALARGKKLYDKRQTIKERDLKRAAPSDLAIG
ncbi:SsrA-binding protein [Cardinium endosymbiont cEper1 of Encarsia pergandiella]|uniref:SsrA-binding protein SmpB n=1 Tax=Cardinium endosymbiont of Encarsia pergandiella TaxID=249402 RepID=UPI00027EA06F|nr:SsrA-binding protein SmpB [Cardinium endosymbiont of Encarsia pergandiella]CCM10141.1 SsrA-binding protein [Cardinium endosymbiont cEper1 of Encarsia pergandiella]